MSKSYEATGKTREEAIDAGLEALGLTIGEVNVDVVEEGSKGLFGLFGSRPWRVRLTVIEQSSVLDTHSLFADSLEEKKPAPKKQPARKPQAEAPAKPAQEKPAQPFAPQGPAFGQPANPVQPQGFAPQQPVNNFVPQQPQAPMNNFAPQQVAPMANGPQTPVQAVAPQAPNLAPQGNINMKIQGYLLRQRTGEKIEMGKPMFKIGKSHLHADYAIEGNPGSDLPDGLHIDCNPSFQGSGPSMEPYCGIFLPARNILFQGTPRTGLSG